MTTQILIVYDTTSGNTRAMAQRIARGVEAVDGCVAVVRTVPRVSAKTEAIDPAVPAGGEPYVQREELVAADGLIIGSPTHFGNMSASLKHWLDQTTSLWLGGALVGKPAAAFTSTGSLHGGQEATLISMMLPLFHHGMLLCGLPYTHPGLMQTLSGGTPYGASHFAGADGNRALDDTEAQLAQLLGTRVAGVARRLNSSKRELE